MRVYDTKNIKFKDGLAEKRHRVFVLKTLFFIGLSVAIIGFILYLLFFSGFLEIRDVSISGLDKVSKEKFDSGLNERLNSKWLGLLERQRNVIFFDSDAFKAEVLAAFPEIKEISVNKEPPHALNIDATERTTAGIWCFTLSEVEGFASGCKYFDKDGVLWGEAAKSSGFLILVIEDMRQDTQEMVRQGSPQVDRELWADIMLISGQLKEMGIFINKFTLPDNFIGDFNVLTSGGYELLFNIDSDISKQLEVLEIFLAEKKDDPDFKPQYIDLRINGRIYYKK